MREWFYNFTDDKGRRFDNLKPLQEIDVSIDRSHCGTILHAEYEQSFLFGKAGVPNVDRGIQKYKSRNTRIARCRIRLKFKKLRSFRVRVKAKAFAVSVAAVPKTIVPSLNDAKRLVRKANKQAAFSA